MEKQEHNLLVFGSLDFGKINHTNGKDAGTTGPTDPIKPNKPDIDNFKPLTPEVDPTEVIIWENENDIYDDEYTLKKNLEMIDGIDGLKTAGGTMINEATINSNASVD